MPARPSSRACTRCELPTRAKTGLCIACSPRPTSTIPNCPGCNKKTAAKTGVCRDCSGGGQIYYDDQHALVGGTWYTKAGGIKVWVPSEWAS